MLDFDRVTAHQIITNLVNICSSVYIFKLRYWLATMASPRTRRVMKDLRIKDNNTVSVTVLFTCPSFAFSFNLPCGQCMKTSYSVVLYHYTTYQRRTWWYRSQLPAVILVMKLSSFTIGASLRPYPRPACVMTLHKGLFYPQFVISDEHPTYVKSFSVTENCN